MSLWTTWYNSWLKIMFIFVRKLIWIVHISSWLGFYYLSHIKKDKRSFLENKMVSTDYQKKWWVLWEANYASWMYNTAKHRPFPFEAKSWDRWTCENILYEMAMLAYAIKNFEVLANYTVWKLLFDFL